MRTQIKVSLQEEGRKLERMFDFDPSTTCRQAVEQACSTFSIPEDWALAMYSRKHGGWIHDDTLIMDIIFKGQKTLELRAKTPSFFEAVPCSKVEPLKTSIRDSTLLRGPSSPIDPHRFFSFFRAPEEHQFVTKFQKGNIYLSALILNSDNKILLSPSGLPPTIMVSNVGGLANYFNFDTESADFAWMFKTTLDWASEPKINRARSDTTALAPTAEPKTSISMSSAAASTLSPPTPRSSFTGSKRASVNSSAASTCSSGTKTTTSSVSADRSSFVSDSTKRVSSIYEYADRKLDYRRENAFRQDYVAAVEQLQRKVGMPPIDLLYDKVIDLPQVGAKNIMAIQYINDESREHVATELVQMGSFRWRSVDSVSNTVYTRKEEVWSQFTGYYDNVRVSKPSPGLYIGLYYTESTMAGLQILVPTQRRTFVPLVKLREQASLSQEEWQWIRSTVSMDLNQLAKNCAVPKDDPMHHLKVEFAHSTAKLSRLTQLKWDPSDMYTLDTMKVVMKNSNVRNSHCSPSSSPPPEQDLASSISSPLPRSLAAMDMDPVWKDHPLGFSDEMETIRVIMFIKPTRHATQPQEHFNSQLFELCPFPIFDALHHSVFNTATYHQLRKTMLHLTNEIVNLELELGMESDEIELPSSEDEKAESSEVLAEEESGMIGSLLIDLLGINGDSSSRLRQGQNPRVRPSFLSGEALHGSVMPISKRSSTDSLIEAFERSIPSASSVLSLASSLSSTGNCEPTAALGPQIQARDVGESASARVSSEEQHSGITVISNRFRSYSSEGSVISPRASWNNGDDENDDGGAFSFKNTLRDFPPQNRQVMVVDGDLSNGARFSICKSTTSTSRSRTSTSSDFSYEDNLCSLSRSYDRRLRHESTPLPPFPQTPNNHRRSFSHFQSIELGVSPSAKVSRSRTTSHSSSVHSRQNSSHNFHHHQQQQPVYRNRFLSQKSYPYITSDVHNQDEPSQYNTTPSQHLDTSKTVVNTNEQTGTHSCPPELQRLEKQQRELQEHWRMVSWTRQLNEWDHARMLRTQGELLGFGIGVGLGLNLGLGKN
ncbi:hypothetical protein BGX28_005798 [Mortierella sp. GBA30]|nr:hypothetical protein BGX28_005798 [Mortierella sp. GBA30]